MGKMDRTQHPPTSTRYPPAPPPNCKGTPKNGMSCIQSATVKGGRRPWRRMSSGNFQDEASRWLKARKTLKPFNPWGSWFWGEEKGAKCPFPSFSHPRNSSGLFGSQSAVDRREEGLGIIPGLCDASGFWVPKACLFTSVLRRKGRTPQLLQGARYIQSGFAVGWSTDKLRGSRHAISY